MDEFRLLPRKDQKAAILGLIGTVECGSACGAFMGRNWLTPLGEGRPQKIEHAADSDIMHADIDVVAKPGFFPSKQRHQYAREPLHPRQDVGGRNACNRRFPITTKRHAYQAAFGLQREIVRRPSAPFAVLSERTDRAIDDARIARPHRLVSDAKLIDSTGTKGF